MEPAATPAGVRPTGSSVGWDDVLSLMSAGKRRQHPDSATGLTAYKFLQYWFRNSSMVIVCGLRRVMMTLPPQYLRNSQVFSDAAAAEF
jgi:hypothetical protein